MPPQVMLTGASGFIGAATLRALLAMGADVVALSRRRPDVEGAFEWRSCDLLDPQATAQALAGVRAQTLLHLA